MYSKLKRLFILIPCMIIGLFLFSYAEVEATEATLGSAVSSVYVGKENKDNIYYFTNSTSWTVKINDYDIWVDGDTSLEYRVIKPDGKATDWSKKVRYPDTNGEFNIDLSSLSFTETVDLSNRNSVAGLSTYYIDVKYFTEYLGFISKDQKKDETIKVIYNDSTNVSLYSPKITSSYNSTGKTYSINAKIVDGNNKGYGIITEMKYLFSATELDLSTSNKFENECKTNTSCETLTFDLNSSVDVSIEEPQNGGYIYILAESGNGYDTTAKIDTGTKVTDPNDPTPPPSLKDEDNKSGLFDYDFGEFILLVLVIVLVLSCVLILTQKIVDYKKRLY